MSTINELQSAAVTLTLSVVTPSGKIATQLGTGFFIDSVHVVTAAHVVLTKLPRVPASSYYLTRVQSIIGVIQNGSNSDVIGLKLIGLSPINDVAVLEAINPPSHATLSFVDPSSIIAGTQLFTYGNLLNRDVRAISSGVMRDDRMTYQGSPILPELIDANISIGGGVSGGPIATAEGGVVGLVSFTLNWLQSQGYLISTGTTVGPRSGTIQKIVNDILAGNNTVTVSDPYGDWLHWQMPGLNATFNYVQPMSFLTAINGISVDGLNAPLPTSVNVGVFVTDIPSGSPLEGILAVGDMITAINGTPVGYESSSQSSVGEILLGLSVGSSVSITYAKASNYLSSLTTSVTLQPLSSTYDVIYSSAQVLSTDYTTRVAYNLGSGNALAPPTVSSSITSPPPAL